MTLEEFDAGCKAPFESVEELNRRIEEGLDRLLFCVMMTQLMGDHGIPPKES